MKNTLILSLAIAIVAVSLFVYGCGPSAQTPEKAAPATSAPPAPAPSAQAPPAAPAAPQAPAATNAPATQAETAQAAPEAAASPDSADYTLSQGPAESNPADLPVPSAP